jgi:HPt (histidine-containing phosphotransfer) domain-containing protein
MHEAVNPHAAARPASVATPVIDPAALARLSELDPNGQTGLVQRLLRTYDGTLGPLLHELRRARAVADVDVMRRIVHTLKSSSASIGAVAFSALCAKAELAVAAGSADSSSSLDLVELELERVARAVRVLLSP